MMTKRNPHRPYASGDTRKEELTKRLCSLVDNSQESCKKVPSAKIPPLAMLSQWWLRARRNRMEHGDKARKERKARVGQRAAVRKHQSAG
ncbi:MAG: hypothetical protein ACYTFM_11905, partial [Planctomycetota bacterium]